MSRQFNYELDEDQIKTLMQNAELEYNEVLWEKFEKMPHSDSNSEISFTKYFQKLNLNINRTIILSLVFVALISGFSSMLFTLIDFKKNPNIGNGEPLMADYRDLEMQHMPIYETEIVKNEKSIIPPTNNAKVNHDSATIITKEETEVKDSIAVESEISSQNTVIENEVIKESSSNSVKRKRKININSEELPVIKTVTNLNEGTVEPELDL
jgi:hypothetical protein